MKKRTSLILLVWSLWATLSVAATVAQPPLFPAAQLPISDRIAKDKAFLESFIRYYEFNTTGRYAHEYHPYLLKQTSASFDQLEDHLGEQGFKLNSRVVLTGYEEHAVPRYFTHFDECNGIKINDEAASKSDAGWSQTLHNRFGLMTGFLFRHANDAFKADEPKICDHLNAHTIEIYDNRTSVFQEDAFGVAYPFMLRSERAIFKKLAQKEVNGVFDELIKFWETLYFGCSMSGDAQVAGTQDILFTIEHARHLFRSTLPLRKYFVGPDITYPIDPSTRCLAEATTNAQQFVQKMVKELIPLNDETTCYVFRSFVDGVGKSTMLGNIKNWMKHGPAIHHYEAVDNTSSQFADLFKYADNVFIADLPAQISHFTHKPDGQVYADAHAEKLPPARLEELTRYVHGNKDRLVEQYQCLLAEVKALVAEQGWHASACSDAEQPEKYFLKNLLLLKKAESNRWVPFTYQQHHYLFNLKDATALRMLKPLAQASSIGLKNAQSEQMLFTEGVRFPLPYKHFLKHFVDQLKAQGIKQIVFVDFLSMYPRSSRENIRINFVLQQMAMLNDNFSPDNSFYRDFVNGNSELFSMLRKRSSAPLIINALKQEAVVRLLLSHHMEESVAEDLVPVPLATIDSELVKRREAVAPEVLAYLDKLLIQKVKSELTNLEALYGLRKDFLNVQSLSLKKLLLFSNKLEKMMTTEIKDHRLNLLWKDCGSHVALSQDAAQGAVEHERSGVPMVGGPDATALFAIHPDSKHMMHLVPFVRMLRHYWHSALSNLLYYSASNNGDQSCERLPVAPVLLKEGTNGLIYMVQKRFEEEVVGHLPLDAKWGILNLKNVRCGKFNEAYYPLNPQIQSTSTGIYGFGFDLLGSNGYGTYPYLAECTTKVVQKAHANGDPENALPASVVLEGFSKDSSWTRHYITSGLKKAEDEQKNKKTKKAAAEAEDPWASESSTQFRERPLYPVAEDKKDGVKLFIRALATLQMLVPDPESNIVIRKGNRQDFAAALQLIERVILIQFFDLVPLQPLFANYDTVDPIIPWDELEEE